MDTSDFIGSVAQRSGASPEQAIELTAATLTTLAERIDGGEARDLASQLPEGIRPYASAPSEAAERFGLDVFLSRVSGRAAVDATLAKAGVRAVFDTLRETVTPGEYDDVIGQLPAELYEVAVPTAPFDAQRSRG
ncbi:DUF2267 domain-containing protein [Micromonosporaceae bacterium B7E4]